MGYLSPSSSPSFVTGDFDEKIHAWFNKHASTEEGKEGTVDLEGFNAMQVRWGGNEGGEEGEKRERKEERRGERRGERREIRV